MLSLFSALRLSLFIISLCFAPISFADHRARNFTVGGVDGGGGVGVRCPVSYGRATLELLDIHEASLRGVRFQHSPQTKAEIADMIAQLATRHYWAPFIGWTKEYYAERLKRLTISPLLDEQPFENPFNDDKLSIAFVNELPLSKI